ncbi:MAG: flagellar hook protein FlgE [Aromatoleum sp.]|jgi:flagellar hook protein FlgE|uniref:flagellar hook protein FlgE n=1 Tax=Aromatoleum sp. TaxID=2307007 RepID=UPI002894E1F7|nr:flagellar hook protein FlgE [Aromatoleum sp.]MDT3668921.1 flagellar hook protein FlgE [Aromatoleum sp.]
MAFQQGLSGLNSASKALDVISNNVANSNTIGFKAGRAEFADVYAAALNGAAAGVQVGIGSAIGAVTQSFSQGNITTTNNPLDVAINGNGFFRMANSDGSVAYTRNGQFDINKNGYIVNAQGMQLTGYPANNGVILAGGDPTAIKLNYSDVSPERTTELAIGMNLDSRAQTPTEAFSAANPKPLDPNNPASGNYNFSTSATLYDALGNSHTATLYFRKEATAGEWTVHPIVDGTTPTTPGSITVTFDPATGKLTSPAAGSEPTLTMDIDNANFGGAPDFNVKFFMGDSTQFGSQFGVNTLRQDGFASGRLTGITIGDDGVILGRYSNGQSRDLGQVVLANFQSPNGLLSLGGNLWAESPDSGQPIVGVPGSANLGLMTAGAVEEANVDLTSELVQLIVQQRAYQANAQSVRAQDTILQTIVNLG